MHRFYHPTQPCQKAVLGTCTNDGTVSCHISAHSSRRGTTMSAMVSCGELSLFTNTLRKNGRCRGRGVVDLRPDVPMVAGRLLRQAVTTAKRIINKVACEHKVGMCICPHRRFIGYTEQGDHKFQPRLMCLLASTSTKEEAWFWSLLLYWSLNGSK